MRRRTTSKWEKDMGKTKATKNNNRKWFWPGQAVVKASLWKTTISTATIAIIWWVMASLKIIMVRSISAYIQIYHVSCASSWHQSDLLLARIFMISTEWPQLFNSKLTILNIESWWYFIFLLCCCWYCVRLMTTMNHEPGRWAFEHIKICETERMRIKITNI